MNVDDMTDEEFIDYCRNGGELSGLITERHPKCDWCGGMCRVGKDGMCRNCRVRERRRTDPEYAQHLRDLANRRNARNREKRNEYARRYRSEHWLRLGLRLVSMPPPISVRWLNTIAVGGRSIPRNTPSMRRSGNINDN